MKYLLVVIVVAVAASRASAQSPRDTTNRMIATPAVLVGDASNPRAFVRILELTSRRQLNSIVEPERDIQQGNDARKQYSEQIDATVDLRSRILISFDRQWIAERITEIDIDPTVTASVKSKDGIRAIEVPGYAYVGKAAQGPSSSLRSLRALEVWREELSSIWNNTYQAMLQNGRLNKLIPDSAVVSPYEALLRTVSQDAIPDKFMIDARRAFLAQRTRLNGVTDKLIREENSRALITLGYKSGRDPDAFKQDLERVRQLLNGLAPDANPKRSTPEAVGDMIEMVELLGSLSGPDIDEIGVRQELVNAIKDTDILVPLTGVSPGDDIILEVKNQADPINSRLLQVKLHVRHYGLVRSITDASFFIRRLGVRQRDVDRATGTLVGEAEASSEVPAPVNFSPAPGVTLGWTYYGWPQSDGKMPWYGAIQPALGFNVSFMRFGSVISKFEPSSGSDVPTATVREVEGGTDVGAGIVIGLFDNAIQAVVGWNLSVEEKRSYAGVGFSFFKVVRQVNGSAQ